MADTKHDEKSEQEVRDRAFLGDLSPLDRIYAAEAFMGDARDRLGWLSEIRTESIGELRSSGMRVEEIAELLGISRARVYALLNEAKGDTTPESLTPWAMYVLQQARKAKDEGLTEQDLFDQWSRRVSARTPRRRRTDEAAVDEIRAANAWPWTPTLEQVASQSARIRKPKPQRG